jgi:hypothetical protein
LGTEPIFFILPPYRFGRRSERDFGPAQRAVLMAPAVGSRGLFSGFGLPNNTPSIDEKFN